MREDTFEFVSFMPPRLYSRQYRRPIFSSRRPLSLSPSLPPISLLAHPFSVPRSRIGINDALVATAKRDHENRFERSRRKLLDGHTLNRPVGDLTGERAALQSRTCKTSTCREQVATK